MNSIKKSWWENATNEQRLSQVESGIELDMTARQLALCLGAKSPSHITTFASRNSLSLDSHEKRSNAAKKSGAVQNFSRPKRFENLSDEDLSPFASLESRK